MGRAKEIIVKVIPSKVANEFVKKHHYSGKVAATGLICFGAFLDNKIIGVAQWGRPINKYLHLHLIENTKWNDFLELNRLVCIDDTPKYTESRFIKICLLLIKKNAPQVKWVMSFADATQCGDGTIYRASGFVLTNINDSKQLYELPNGDTLHLMGLQGGQHGALRKKMLESGYGNAKKYMVEVLKGKPLVGKQLKYIYLIDKSCKITVPILPFSKIDEMGAGMYKGKKVSLQERKQAFEVNEDKRSASSREIGGSNPTQTLIS
jgi:hypothetical protein